MGHTQCRILAHGFGVAPEEAEEGRLKRLNDACDDALTCINKTIQRVSETQNRRIHIFSNHKPPAILARLDLCMYLYLIPLLGCSVRCAAMEAFFKRAKSSPASVHLKANGNQSDLSLSKQP